MIMKTIDSVGGQPLRPKLALPNQAHIVAVELIPEPKSGSLELVSYVALFRGSAEQLYNNYRNFYRSATARWTGKVQQQGRAVYFFAVAVQLGRQGGRVVFKMSDKIDEEEKRAYNLSEGKESIMHATLWSPNLDSMLKSKDGLTILLPRRL